MSTPVRPWCRLAGLLGLLGLYTGLALGAAPAPAPPQSPPPAPMQMPGSGPPTEPGRSVIYLASDFRNGGVTGVYRALEEAARLTRWQVHAEDGGGASERIGQQFSQALDRHPDALVLGGFDPLAYPEQTRMAARLHVVLVGWHAAQNPGPGAGLFYNVSTDPADVARMAADFVLDDARRRQKPVGVVIFNDDQFSVANTKTQAMKKRIEACEDAPRCQVLAVENIRISEAGERIPERVPQLSRQFGPAWTHSLAINDIYFDSINFPLLEAGRPDIVNVSAGDGSIKALSRIRSGRSQQAATVAEPLSLQGYQLLDEINRALQGVGPSGYVPQALLVVAPGQAEAQPPLDAVVDKLKKRYLSSWLGRP